VKALSLWQPWATLVMLGAKRLETRSWPTTHRGPLFIHASSKTSRELIELCHEEPFCTALRAGGIARWQDLPRGGFLGVVKLVDVRQMAGRGFPGSHVVAVDPRGEALPWLEEPPAEPERSFGRYEAGRFAWYLEEPRAFDRAVPYRARQRLFNVTPEELGFEAKR
jgi:hypothetical protein